MDFGDKRPKPIDYHKVKGHQALSESRECRRYERRDSSTPSLWFTRARLRPRAVWVGNNGVTNSYAAALWAMDYFCYLAYNTNLAGMNLHTGPIGSNSGSYNAISPVGAASSYALEAPGYGLWAFHYGSQGQPLSTTITNPSNANITTYGLLEANGGETVHIINKTSGDQAVDVTANIAPGGSYTAAQVIVLKQENDDVTATSGITFGGAPMGGDGTWIGGYGPQQSLTGGVFTVTVPHSQAVVVHFY